MEQAGGPLEGPVIIEPVDFRGTSRATRRRRLRRPIAFFFWLTLVAGLAVAGWFVLTARPVRLTVEPEPDRVEVSGAPLRFRIGEHHLLRRGTYEVHARLEGHHPLRETFEVGPGHDDELHFVMRELPGIVTLECIDGAEVVIDGSAQGAAPIGEVELEGGVHAVALERDRYQPLQTEIEVEGRGRRQVVTLEMRPDWADVTIESGDVGAEVWVDGTSAGFTPTTLEVLSGPRRIELTAEGFEPWRRELEIVAEQPVALTGIVLDPARGRIIVETDPSGAQVVVDGEYAGTTPVEVGAAPNRELLVQVARDGYEPDSRSIRLDPGKTANVAFELTARMGTIRLEVAPSDAFLLVDGEEWGVVPSEIELTAQVHELEFRKEGFEPQARSIRPRVDVPQRIAVELQPIREAVETSAPEAVAANGYPMVLIRPGAFTMGASRREQGRRSNETLRSIELVRPFHLGAREVTNAEYNAFSAEHQSGDFETIPLGGEDRPVVRVSWDDAARFCNWLSAQDDLSSAYVEREGVMWAVEPMGNGYRLPTEAEWEYAARMDGTEQGLKFPWGEGFPPRTASGNYADDSASGLLNVRIPDYDDGFAGPAPVGSFDPSDSGLHDMGGNVAEWCHDFYTMYTYDPRAVAVDPMGPAEGRHHVVRGSSWRDASISELRFSHRNYDDSMRDDLGFRICRYLDEDQADE